MGQNVLDLLSVYLCTVPKCHPGMGNPASKIHCSLMNMCTFLMKSIQMHLKVILISFNFFTFKNDS